MPEDAPLTESVPQIMVYVLELKRPLGTPRHQATYYVGWCKDNRLEARIAHHRNGTGAAFTRAAVERGIEFDVVLTIPGATRADERRIKNQKNTRRFVERQLAQNGAQS